MLPDAVGNVKEEAGISEEELKECKAKEEAGVSEEESKVKEEEHDEEQPKNVVARRKSGLQRKRKTKYRNSVQRCPSPGLSPKG